MTLQIPSCHHLLISLAFFLAAATLPPASAGDHPVNDGPSTKVKFGDLDLNTDAGRRQLLERLNKAASRVCEDYANLNWSSATARSMARASKARLRLLSTRFTTSRCPRSLRPRRI